MNTHTDGLRAALRKRKALLLLTLAALVAIGALATCREETKTQASVPVERKKIKVVLETVAPRPLNDLLVLLGETEALHGVKLSAERSGRVEQVPVKEGDFVRAGQVIAGFAAETQDLLQNAQAKLSRKGLDIVVANVVGQPDSGFGSDMLSAAIIDVSGAIMNLGDATKASVAEALFDQIACRFQPAG